MAIQWIFFQCIFQLHLDRNQGDQQNAASTQQKSIIEGEQNPPRQQMKQDRSKQSQGQSTEGKLCTLNILSIANSNHEMYIYS